MAKQSQQQGQMQQGAWSKGQGESFHRSAAFTVWTEGPVRVHGPVLMVIRLMGSPRHVLCQFGERRDVVCDVRNASNFRKGMMIYGARRKYDGSTADGVADPDKVWVFEGKLPRRLGKW